MLAEMISKKKKSRLKNLSSSTDFDRGWIYANGAWWLVVASWSSVVVAIEGRQGYHAIDERELMTVSPMFWPFTPV